MKVSAESISFSAILMECVWEGDDDDDLPKNKIKMKIKMSRHALLRLPLCVLWCRKQNKKKTLNPQQNIINVSLCH